MSNIEAGYAGAQRASDHADRTGGDVLWSKIARLRFLEFLVKIQHETVSGRAKFTCEDFRDFVFLRSLPDPPDPRAFGNVIRLEAKRGRCRKTGRYVRSNNPQCHGRDIAEWEVVL